MDRNKLKYLAGLCAIALFVQLSIAQVPCEYDVTVIAAPTDCGIFGTVITVGLGINENGAVVGFYYCPLWEHTEAFVWSAKDGFVTLDRPEGVYSAGAVDINDNGVICGTAWMFDLGQRGFVYEDGKMIILHPVVPDAGWSSASAINNAGVVVGQRSITEDLQPQVAYMWSKKDGFDHLEGLEKLSSATAINGNLITGWTANTGEYKEGFLWDNGDVTLLGYIPGGFTSTPGGVNSIGVICGSGRVQNEPDGPISVLGFVWDNGVFTLIEPIDGYDTSGSGCINDGGQITGFSVNLEQPTDRHGFVWIEGVTHDLNELVPDEELVLVERAKAINNVGQIVSDGDLDGENTFTFLLTPVNAPLGDLNDDCIVELDDLKILLGNWGRCPSKGACETDLDQNGITNTTDLLILLANWI